MASKRPSEPPAYEILHRGPGHLFASHRNVFLSLWCTQGTGPLVQRMGELADAHAAAHPEGFSSAQLVTEGTPLATGEARDALVALMRRHQARTAAIGTVLEGRGFWASATRSLVLGLRLLMPRSLEMQTFETTDELAAWLVVPHQQKTGVAIRPAELASVLTALRAELR